MRIQVANALALLPEVETPEAWSEWATTPQLTGEEKCQTLPKRVPMMTARRMSLGVRYANEVALSLVDGWQPDAVVFSSRHGELARGEKIMTTLAQGEEISPTDFMVSVHNTAVGLFTIAGKLTVPSSSVAAGADSFAAGLLEAGTLMASGAQRVLLVDFDGALSPILGKGFAAAMPSVNYAVGLALEATNNANQDDTLSLDFAYDYSRQQEPTLPVSLGFYAAWLQRQRGAADFTLTGNHCTLTGHWEAHHD